MPSIATLVATDRTDFDISWSLNFICLSKPSFLQTRHESWFQVFSSKSYNLAYNYFQQNCSLFFKLVSELNVTFFNLKIPKQVKSLPTFEITSQKSYMICPKNCRKFTINWNRLAVTSMFGFGFVGPVGHFWGVWNLSVQYITHSAAKKQLLLSVTAKRFQLIVNLASESYNINILS